MAPIPTHIPTFAQEKPTFSSLKLKNTFLHIDDGDEFDLDEGDWMMRRQVSAPVGFTRQVSSQKPTRGPSKLVSCAENQEEDPFDLNDANTILRQVSASQGAFDRQVSSISAAGFDRQVSAAGFTRQTTEQQWPEQQWPTYTEHTYTTYEDQFPQDIGFESNMLEQSQYEPTSNGIIFLDEATPQQDQAQSASSDDAYVGGHDQVDSPLGNAEGASSMSLNPLMMQQFAAAYTMNTMMWTAMMNQQAAMSGSSSTESSAPPKNRRKANSLITKAQEAQKQKQQMEMAQFQLLQQHQLQQQLQGWLGMNPAMMNKAKSENMPAAAASAFSAKEAAPVKPFLQAQAKNDSSEDCEQKFCPNCGGGVRRHHKFCQSCGSNISGIW